MTRQHGHSIYDRAADRYRCGRIGNGPRCEIGPDWQGNCRSQECTPKLRRNWLIKRASLLLGIVGVCLVVAVLATPVHREVFAPGPLTRAHAQILNGKAHTTGDQNRCAACHETGKLPALSWLTGFHQQNVQQHSLCLDCHQRQMPDLVRRLPHDLPKYALDNPDAKLPQLPGSFVGLRRELSNNTRPQERVEIDADNPLPASDLKSSTPFQPPIVAWRESDLACSDCHREHQGAGHDLQSMTNERCQSCHRARFSSFANGHPEFRGYPYNRPVQLAFDHRRHRDLHYAKDQKAFDCRACHVSQTDTGQVGQVFRSVAFEQACAQCHTPSILASNMDGLVLFQLPSIDKTKLGNANPLVQAWPEEAGQIMDGQLPPLMQLLLLADPDLQTAFQQLGREPIDFARLDLQNPEQRQALLTLLQGTQKLLKDLADNGQATIRNRLAMARWRTDSSHFVATNTEFPSVLGLKTTSVLETQQQAALFEGLPPDLFRQALRSWFAPPPASQSSSLQTKDSASRILPPLADALSTGSSQRSSKPNPNGNDDLLSGAGDTDLLRPLAAKDPTSELEGTPSPLPGQAGDQGGRERASRNQDWKLRPLRPGQQLEAGGWMIDERRLAIVYIPKGHGDPFVAAWTGLAKTLQPSNLDGAEDPSHSNALWHATNALLSPKATGRCVECHRLNQEVHEIASSAERGKLVGLETALWRTQRRPATLRQATRFDHGPHLILPTLTDCVACHRLAPAIPTASAVESDAMPTTPWAHHANGRGSEFESMNKNDCASCHRTNAAGDSCTLCHNYHVGEASWVWDRREFTPNDPQIADRWRATLKR